MLKIVARIEVDVHTSPIASYNLGEVRKRLCQLVATGEFFPTGGMIDLQNDTEVTYFQLGELPDDF